VPHSDHRPAAQELPATRRAGPSARPWFTRSTTFLRRGDDAVQVGVDTDDAVLLTGVAPALADVLTLVDGRQTLPTLRRAARRHRVPDGQLDGALALLRQAGLVEFRTADPRPQDPATPDTSARPLAEARLCIVGDGPLGAGLAGALARSGLAELRLAPGPAGPVRYPGPGSAALARRLTADAPEARITVVRHCLDPELVPADLTVIATEAAEPDRVLGAGLVRADQPHLIVRTVGELAVVGPLVLPGRTACLRCLDLTRAGADPDWPELVAQLCRTRVPSPEVLTRWVVGTALVQILAALRYVAEPTSPGRPTTPHHPPETLGATVELTGSELAPRLRRWPGHPGCGCGWGGPAE
jgi:hypothetical protein